MHKNKTLKIYLCLIFILYGFCKSHSSDDDSDPYGGSPTSSIFHSSEKVLVGHKISSTSSRPLITQINSSTKLSSEKEELEQYFRSTLRSVFIPESVTEAFATGVASGLALFAFQYLPASFMWGLENLGLTIKVLPAGSDGSLALIAGAGGVAAFMIWVAAREGIKKIAHNINLWKVGQTKSHQNVTIDPQASYFRKFANSYFPVAWDFCTVNVPFFLHQIWTMESNVRGWGPPLIWQLGFGIPGSIAAGVITSKKKPMPPSFPGGNPHQQAFSRSIKDASITIQHKGLTPKAEELAKELNIILRDLPQNSLKDENESHSEEKLDNPLSEEDVSSPDLEASKPYLFEKVSAQIQEVALERPERDRTYSYWSENIASKLGLFLSVTDIPVKMLLKYGMLCPLLEYWGVPSGMAQYMTLTLTIITALFDTPTSITDAPIIADEVEQVAEFFNPRLEINYFSDILSYGISRSLALLYVGFPAERHMENILPDIPFIPLAAQSAVKKALIIPLLIKLVIKTGQFSEGTINSIVNFFKTGGVFNCCQRNYKMCGCDRNGNNLTVINTQGKLEKLSNKLLRLNSYFTQILNNSIVPNERAPLLPQS